MVSDLVLPSFPSLRDEEENRQSEGHSSLSLFCVVDRVTFVSTVSGSGRRVSFGLCALDPVLSVIEVLVRSVIDWKNSSFYR